MRVKRGVHAAKKRRTTLERASGYRGQRSRVEVDRRLLSELATNDPATFKSLVEVARKTLAAL